MRASRSARCFLAAGDLVGELLQGSALLHLPIGHPGQDQGQEDVILEGKGIQQVEILEYKAQILPPEGGQTAPRGWR